jgi:CBS domain-containing protein
MIVRDVMSIDVVSVAPNDSAWTAAELLARTEFSGLPVVDADLQVQGVVTDLDLIRVLDRGADLHELTVAQVMHSRPLFVEPDTSLTTAAGLMEEWQIRRLPVCERGRVIGVISRGDVLRAFLARPARR